MTDDPTRRALATISIGIAAGVALGYYFASSTTSVAPKLAARSETERVVFEFLDAQSERDLDKMCALVDENIVYINEPHPEERAIRGRKMFREAFAESPCIWCEKADLKVLQSSYQGGDTVFVERHDRFFVDGHWLGIPICGYLKVKDGKVVLWKDYWWVVCG